MSRSVFETLSPEQQHLLPEAVSPKQIERIVAEVAGAPRYDIAERWPGSALESLITTPKFLAPMRRCYGEDLRLFKAVYEEWRKPNAANMKSGRQRLHRDYAPEPQVWRLSQQLRVLVPGCLCFGPAHPR